MITVWQNIRKAESNGLNLTDRDDIHTEIILKSKRTPDTRGETIANANTLTTIVTDLPGSGIQSEINSLKFVVE